VASVPDNVQRGDKLKASEVRELAKLAKRGARPIRATANSGLTIREDISGTTIGFDVRKFTKAVKATNEVRYGFVVEVAETASPQEVLVRFLKPTKSGEPESHTWTWVQDGDPRVALVPPNFAGADFAKLKKSVFGSNVPVVRCERIDENWILTFVPRWAFRDLPAGATVTRCA